MIREPAEIALSTTTAELHAEDSSLSGGYDPFFFERLARIEGRHFWFCARNRLIFQLARSIGCTMHPGSLVVEVGCGTGNVLQTLCKACPHCTVVGLELWFEGLRHAKSRSAASLVQADLRDYPLSQPVDLMGMFDVLEHVPEDRKTLVTAWNSLAPGGRLLLTVPAHQFLWSYFDEAAHHCRRYSTREIRDKLTEAGFVVDFVSQFMACTFPLVWLVRKMPRKNKRTDTAAARARTEREFVLIPFVNEILKSALSVEAAWVARRHRLPFGTSLVAIARKPA